MGALGLCALALTAVLFAAPEMAVDASGSQGPTVAEPPVVMAPAELEAHLQAFQQISDEHGDRAMHGPGFQGSVDYVAERLEAAGYEVSFDEFTLELPVAGDPPLLEQTAPDPTTYVHGTDFVVTEMATLGNATGEVVMANPSGGGAVCGPEDLDGLPDDRVLVVRFDECGLLEFWPAWAEAGPHAAGVLVAPRQGEQGLLDPGELVVSWMLDTPMLLISGDVADVLTANPGTEVMMDSGAVLAERTAANVIVETDKSGGDTGEVVMLGAHLDSVPLSPGINDNASGVAALLTLAEQIASSDVVLDKELRFGFWAAEELGLLGSVAYLDAMPTEEIEAISAYLNFDMIGSPNGGRFVYDPAVAEHPETVPAGSQEIYELFEAWFAQQGLATASYWGDERHDHYAFGYVGVPVGGLVSGMEERKSQQDAELFGGEAGERLDPCYHLACDTLENVDRQLLHEMSTAIAAVSLHLAGASEPRPEPLPLASAQSEPVVAHPTFAR